QLLLEARHAPLRAGRRRALARLAAPDLPPAHAAPHARAHSRPAGALEREPPDLSRRLLGLGLARSLRGQEPPPRAARAAARGRRGAAHPAALRRRRRALARRRHQVASTPCPTASTSPTPTTPTTCSPASPAR